MHAAKIDRSPRLRRVLAVLRDGRWHSTREIAHEANVLAVNSCVAELRANGCVIECSSRKAESGQRYFTYRLRPRQTDLLEGAA